MKKNPKVRTKPRGSQIERRQKAQERRGGKKREMKRNQHQKRESKM